MTANRRYAVDCPLTQAKALVKAIETVFERKLSLSKNADMLAGHRPQVLDRVWFNLTKVDGLYLGLWHNRDTEGRLELPDHPNRPWILFTRVNAHYTLANGGDPEHVQQLAAERIGRIPYDVLLIEESE